MMKEKLKQIWKWMNGKKTTIGMLLMLLAQGMQAFFPETLTTDQIQFIQTAGAAVGGVGVIHKGTKTKVVQRIMKTKPREK
jgi:ABC-type phosphate transport system auxiliary subunit